MTTTPAPGADKATDERALFESESLRLDIIDDEGFERYDSGDYVDEPSHVAWRAWQARAALVAVPASDPVSGAVVSQPDPATWGEAVLLAGIQAICISADQEWCRQNGALSEFDKGWFMGQLLTFDMYTSVEKSAIAEAREYIGKLSALAAAAPAPVSGMPDLAGLSRPDLAWTTHRMHDLVSIRDSSCNVIAITYANDGIAIVAAHNATLDIPAPQAPDTSGAPSRAKLDPMQSDDDAEAGIIRQWYFSCDDHYIDVALDNGKYSIFFRERAASKEAWFDQADQPVTAPLPAAPAPTDHIILHVRDFGAVGDGVTDDTSALQRAVDARAALAARQAPTEAPKEPVNSDFISARKFLAAHPDSYFESDEPVDRTTFAHAVDHLDDAIKLVDQLDHYARQLAMHLWREHYSKEAPQFELLDDAYGVLSQIDNMLTGMARKAPDSRDAALEEAANEIAPEHCDSAILRGAATAIRALKSTATIAQEKAQ